MIANNLKTIIVDATAPRYNGSIAFMTPGDFYVSEDPYFASEVNIVGGLVKNSTAAQRVVVIARQDQMHSFLLTLVLGLGFELREGAVSGDRRLFIWESKDRLR